MADAVTPAIESSDIIVYSCRAAELTSCRSTGDHARSSIALDLLVILLLLLLLGRVLPIVFLLRIRWGSGELWRFV